MYCICVCRCMQKPELHPSTSANHQTRDSKIYITSHTYMYTPTATTILYIQFCIRFHGSQYIYMILSVMLHGRYIELQPHLFHLLFAFITITRLELAPMCSSISMHYCEHKREIKIGRGHYQLNCTNNSSM